MRIVTDDQRSADWLLQRRGRITASRIKHVLDVLKKGGESEKRFGYKLQLVAERTTCEVSTNFTTPEMKFGTDNEPFARVEYEIESGNTVDQVGFILHPTLDYAGASPDGLIGNDGAVEFKVPKSETHIRWMDEKILPAEHEPQCAWVLACTGRKWIDFTSFDPRQKQLARLFTVRLERDEKRIEQITEAVIAFNQEIEAMIASLPRIKETPVEHAPEFSQWADEFDKFMQGEVTP